MLKKLSWSFLDSDSLDNRWRKRVLLAAILWFIFCLLYTAPAVLFSALLRSVVPQLQLQNVSGSVWHGSATQAFWLQSGGQQNNRLIALGSFEWHLQPWSLLWLHPSAHVVTRYGDQFIDARVRVSALGSVALSQASAALPAALLSSWAPVSARGQLAVKLERAEVARGQLAALQGSLSWQQAQWQWNSHWLALGDYRCELSMPAAQQLRCVLQGSGRLALEGVVDVDTKEHLWDVQTQVTLSPALPEDFRQSVQLMLAAQPDKQGKFSVKRNGRW